MEDNAKFVNEMETWHNRASFGMARSKTVSTSDTSLDLENNIETERSSSPELASLQSSETPEEDLNSHDSNLKQMRANYFSELTTTQNL